MDHRLWFAGIGLASILVVWALHQAGRRKANAHLLAKGRLVEGEILKCEVHADRFAWTDITYAYVPEGAEAPVTVTRRLDGGVRLAVGERVPVRYLPSHPSISIIEPYAKRHDAS